MDTTIHNQRLSLSGRWKLMWTDGQRGMKRPEEACANYASGYFDLVKWLDAEVPGEVHLDLIRAGILDEPTMGLHVLSARWVEESIWFYRRTFTVPEEALAARSWLYFAGLDYSATVYLNGKEVGSHSNFFSPYRVEVGGLLREGENVLVVQLESGLFSVAEKPVSGMYFTNHDTLINKRLWLRKPQSSFSWDWSPRLINVGMHGDVWLEWAERVHVDTVAVRTELTDDFTEGTVHLTAHVEGLDEGQTKVNMRIKWLECGGIQEAEAAVPEGAQALQFAFPLDHPRLWWPMGQGEPYLYGVEITLTVGETVCYRQEKRIGFRHVRLNQDPHPDGGRYFIFEINGRPVFMKGANMVPADLIFARLDRSRYEGLIGLAAEANFNMLRVWGGGLYESDDFYELCDEYGIVVWQDFIFACGGYPGTDAEFLRNVKEEAVYQVRRLAGHPSHIVWCGNNEIEWLTWDRSSGVVNNDYEIYHRLLPQIIRREDPAKLYVPSSPHSPDYEFPNKDDVGDQHPWSVGIDNGNFYDYRGMICRFPNEGGYLGPSSLDTMQSCLPEGQEHMHSLAWQIHDNGVETWFARSGIDTMLAEWIGRNPREMALSEYVYYGGLIQGEALREYIDNFRRRMFDCAAAIFWMYNDCWPTTRSWTIVDYNLHRTPSYYPVKRAFAPISVVIADEGGMLNVYGINDTEKDWSGTVRYGIFELSGRVVADRTADAAIPANRSVCIARLSNAGLHEMPSGRAAFAQLESRGSMVARNRLMLCKLAEMKWAQAYVEIERSGDELVFTSDAFAWGVCLDLHGKTELPDNFFDLWPGIPYRLAWPADRELPVIVRTGN